MATKASKPKKIGSVGSHEITSHFEGSGWLCLMDNGNLLIDFYPGKSGDLVVVVYSGARVESIHNNTHPVYPIGHKEE